MQSNFKLSIYKLCRVVDQIIISIRNRNASTRNFVDVREDIVMLGRFSMEQIAHMEHEWSVYMQLCL